MAFKPVRQVHKDPASCAIFGAISFNGTKLPGNLAVRAICEAAHERGGSVGNGVAFADPQRSSRGKRLAVLARNQEALKKIRTMLGNNGQAAPLDFQKLSRGSLFEIEIGGNESTEKTQNMQKLRTWVNEQKLPETVRIMERGNGFSIWVQEENMLEDVKKILSGANIPAGFVPAQVIYEAITTLEYLPLLSRVIRANAEMPLGDSHVISFGHGIHVFKGLELLGELDHIYRISEMNASAMIAHTRVPTGSEPETARAHPYAYGNVAIVHNGDVTSYSANLRACESKLVELAVLGGLDAAEFLRDLRRSWVGTDSEVIAAMIYTLLKAGIMSEPGLSIPSIMNTLVPPFDNALTRLLRGSDERERLDRLALEYQGCALDGPVACIALVTFEDETHLVAFRDRNTFRMLQVVIDHENGAAYVASDLRQILAATNIELYSQGVESFSLEPGNFVWISSKSGIKTTGRKSRPFIPVPKDICGEVLAGKLGQFSGDKIDGHRKYRGTLGSFGGSFTHGQGTFELFGSMQDNCFEGSSLSTVIGHCNASMDTGNTFQGRQFFLRGSLDTNGFKQFRPNEGHFPVGIVGETAGQNFGRMMSGGIAILLGLHQLGREDINTPIVGPFVGTGMVGGAIFLRDHVIDDLIGKPPSRRDVIAVCANLMEEGLITSGDLREIRHDALNLTRIRQMLKNQEAIARLSPLFEDTLSVERRVLKEEEIALVMPYLDEYFGVFDLSNEWLKRVVASYWTIVKPSRHL